MALRGHRVTVFERDSEPGGQLLLNRHVPGREEMAGHIPWLANGAAKAGVRLEFSVEANVALVMGEQPDIVIVATGAVPGLPQIPGIMNSPMVDAYEVLRRPKGAAGRALVIGGGIRGVGVARALAENGVEIVLVEPGRELVTDIASRSRRFQIEGLTKRANVTVHTGVTVEELKEHSARALRRQESNGRSTASTSSFRRGCSCRSTGSPTRSTSRRTALRSISSATACTHAMRSTPSTRRRRSGTGCDQAPIDRACQFFRSTI